MSGDELQREMDQAIRDAELCQAHRKIALAWRDHFYSPNTPSDWPGTASGILDNRRTHAERAEDWTKKNLAEVRATIALCQSGISAQCSTATEAA